jgi:hypothetical protein
MKDSNNLIAALCKEAERIEEDSIHSAKGHFNTAVIWNRRHYWLGVPATAFGALAGAAFVKDCPEIASLLSLAATILTALVTFLKPTERASEHKTAGDQYLALRNDARLFREIELLAPEDGQPLTDKIKALSQRRNELNQGSPEIPSKAFERAKIGIANGEASYRADKES